ncbi:MAG: Abi family protein, partial [Clostridia bacterium]|nr:Abi family protein [Clostridia bacterium]
MDLKKPLTFDEQISKLKEHGLVIADTVSAKNILQTTNYYRISGYALSFRETLDQNKYIKGTEFEHIYQLYKFDENIRNLCRKYIEKAEIYYRTQISYGFAIRKCKQPPYDQHYDINNFYNKKGYAEIIENFKKEKNYYKDSLIVQHHKYKYSDRMPLWVIVE